VRSNKIKYYNPKKIDETHAQYRMIIGERSNGKTYAILNKILENYFTKNEQGAVVRRWQDDFKGKRALSMFAPLVTDNMVYKYSQGRWDRIDYRSGCWYPARYDEQTDTIVRGDEPIAYAFSLSSMEHDKSTSYPKITTICFDEFLTRQYYLVDEFVLFMNVVSTIVRQRLNVTIYMLGNTVNWTCPYFTEMGIKHIRDMKQGSIDVYTYGESGLRVAVEYCQSMADSKQSNVYFAFDNPRLQMITSGAWELDIYPHLPVKYEHKEIKGIFFICFEGDTLQCEMVHHGRNVFIYIHRKTTPIKDYDHDIIFALNNDYRINHYQSLIRPRDKISQAISFLVKQNKIYYQDNEVGEIVRNYRQASD
jgi:hypothetical protein